MEGPEGLWGQPSSLLPLATSLNCLWEAASRKVSAPRIFETCVDSHDQRNPYISPQCHFVLVLLFQANFADLWRCLFFNPAGVGPKSRGQALPGPARNGE